MANQYDSGTGSVVRPFSVLSSLCCLLCCLIAALGLNAPSFAQVETATLSGTITDPTGAVIAGAEVRARRIETNTESTSTTNGSGIYLIVGLQPGHYRIFVTKQGFKQVNLTDVTLNVQESVNRNFALQVGATSETVTVRADDLHINTTDAAVSTVVDRQFVENMPLNGRSFQSLIALVPGVLLVPGGSTGNAGEFSVNGQRTESNYYTVDGVSANTGTSPLNSMYSAGVSGSVPGETALGTTQSLVSIDALQEFRIQTSTYSAEYGRTPGGQISLVTRSGTNDWHGSAFEYFRNDVLDANNWFNNASNRPRNEERQNDFGGTLGGPISVPGGYNGKDRTFFFFSYEGLRLREPVPAFKTEVPDLFLRQNSPTAIQPILNAFPLPDPNSPILPNNIAIFTASYSRPSTLDSTSIRIDHSVNDKFKLFGRFGDSPSALVSRSEDAATVETSNTEIKTLTLGATNIFSPRLGNELRFNYTWNTATFSTENDTFGGAQPITATQFFAGGILPSHYLLNAIVPSPVFLGLQKNQAAQRQLNITDTFSTSHGAHNLKFGVDYRRLPIIGSDDMAVFSVVYFYSTDMNVLQNSPLSQVQSPGSIVPEPVFTNFSAFAQDDWKATNRLSVSFGVRWDVNPAPGNARGNPPANLNQITNLATAQLLPTGSPVWQTTYHNFAPRFGLAYQLRQSPGHETVLRGGFGVFYDTGNTTGAEGFDGPGFVTFSNPTSGYPLPPADLILPPPDLSTPYNATFAAYDPHLRLPYTLQWNVAIEQALGASQVLTVNYVGSGARELLLSRFYFPIQLVNQYGNFGLQVNQNGATSDYNSFQAQFQRRLSHGLQALASYTWSHSIDDSSTNFFNFNLFRGNSDFDIRHNFQAAITYDVPSGYENPAARAILGHWGFDSRISARSALPFDITGGRTLLPDGSFVSVRPDIVPGQPIYLSDPTAPGGRVVNYNAFAQPTGLNGDAPRNFVRGFAGWQADLALRRDFPLHERLKLQFRAEAFNLFNHPNFGAIENSLTDGPTLFGRVIATLNNSLGGIGSLYQIGGPRSIQLALKLIF